MAKKKEDEKKDEKKRFVLRLNPDMMRALEQWSQDEFRSINGQLEWIIHQALKEAGRLKKDLSDGPGDNSGED